MKLILLTLMMREKEIAIVALGILLTLSRSSPPESLVTNGIYSEKYYTIVY